MNYERKELKIEDLKQMKDDGLLEVNPEYQRGSAWAINQRKMFIDSILRGYPIPVIFLYQKGEEAYDPIARERGQSNKYEIIDGQQRLESLRSYIAGEYKLINSASLKEAKFPNFLQGKEVPWSGKEFEDLGEQDRKNLLQKKISIVIIKQETDSKSEARDLFIRLQTGSALNDQEKRDAWPGMFTKFIFKVGGKYDSPGNVGHDFFGDVMGLRTPSRTDRGKVRKLAAQMYMLYSAFSENKGFLSIKKEALDSLYRINASFDKESEEAKNFIKCLDTLKDILSDKAFPKMKNHEAFHSLLLVSSLLGDANLNARWKHGLKNAFEEFRRSCAKATAITDDEEKSKNEYWIHYIQHTKTSADRPITIARRHEFFSRKILEHLIGSGFLVRKDSKRAFSSVEREIIYFRDEKTCGVCRQIVVWRDAEIHHVIPHSEGGETALENGALVHQDCHPKRKKEVKEFAEKFQLQNEKKEMVLQQGYSKGKKKKKTSVPPGTKARGFYKGKEYFAEIGSTGKWNLLDENGDALVEDSPSGAAKAVTGTSVNGRRFWEVKRPDDKNWIPLSSL